MRENQVILIRHGETPWSLSGQHTGSTDLELTLEGKKQAKTLALKLQDIAFDFVFTSPLKRAEETCSLAGLGPQVKILEDLKEWDYGTYEGLTHQQILEKDPQWNLFNKGAPGGESPKQIKERASKVANELKKLHGTIAVFSHGHFLRALMTQWIDQPIQLASFFLLSTASISILGYERGIPVVCGWNKNDLK